MKYRAALRVAYNWRIQQRLLRLTAYARSIGLAMATEDNSFNNAILYLL